MGVRRAFHSESGRAFHSASVRGAVVLMFPFAPPPAAGRSAARARHVPAAPRQARPIRTSRRVFIANSITRFGKAPFPAVRSDMGHPPRRHHHPWWLITFASIGIVATLTVVVTLFTGLGRRPPDARIFPAPEGTS